MKAVAATYRTRRHAHRLLSIAVRNAQGHTIQSGLFDKSIQAIGQLYIKEPPKFKTRWQDAIFEDWNTLTVLRNRKQHMDNANTARNESKASTGALNFVASAEGATITVRI